MSSLIKIKKSLNPCYIADIICVTLRMSEDFSPEVLKRSKNLIKIIQKEGIRDGFISERIVL